MAKTHVRNAHVGQAGKQAREAVGIPGDFLFAGEGLVYLGVVLLLPYFDASRKVEQRSRYCTMTAS